MGMSARCGAARGQASDSAGASDREHLIPIEWIGHIDNKVHVPTRAT